MIVLDTNVISEAWKPQPSAQVLRWMDAQSADTLFISAITIAELRLGLAVMPLSKRRDHFYRQLESALLPAFFGRVLPFDLEASGAYSQLMAKARKAGKAISAADGYIAATAASRGMMVASRDTAPFKAADVAVINPWNDA
jgi:toxin FitB